MPKNIDIRDGGARRPDKTSGDQRVMDDDLDSEVEHPPGTPDDAPYTMTEVKPDEPDPYRADTRDDEQIERDEDSDLWRHQQALIDEDRDTNVDLTGFSDEEAAEIMETMGEGADEPSSGQTVETRVGGPEHGGFRERT